MKSIVKYTLLPLLAFGGALCAAEQKAPEPFMPQHSHRMTVFSPSHLSYEYLPNDDIYIGVDAEANHSYNVKTKHSAIPAHLELTLGRSYFYNYDTHFRPLLGGGIMRDLRTFEVTEWSFEHGQFVTLDELKSIGIGYGLIGATVDHEFNSRLALGLTVKAIVGGPIGHMNPNERSVFGSKSVYYGGDFSLPLMLRLGAQRNWEIRLEPYALVLNDGNRYIGHRSGVAYRF